MSRRVLPEGVFKMTPENFVVQEIMYDAGGNTFPLALYTKSLVNGFDPNLPFTVLCMTKVGWGTQDAVEEVARGLGVPVNRVRSRSLKDKRAWTSQPISVAGPFRTDYEHETIHLVQMYEQGDHLRRGRDYHGNHFTINVLCGEPDLDFSAVKVIRNLWGRQRLGKPGSEKIGLALLEGRFDDAIQMLLDNRDGEKALNKARGVSGGSWMDALFHKAFAYNFGFEVEKWQSHLWNLLFQELDAAGDLPKRLAMWQPTDEVANMYRHLWNPSGNLHPKALDVLGKQRRPTTVSPENLQAKYKDGVWRFQFDLPPSVYATVVLDQLFQLKESFERD